MSARLACSILGGLAAVVAVAACSLTNLDGFAGGGSEVRPSDDAGRDPTGDSGALDAAPFTRDSGDAALAADPYAAVVLEDRPVAWWRFEDPAGSTSLHDEVSDHDGTLVPVGTPSSSVTFDTPGAVGKAGRFGGAGYFEIGDVFDFVGPAEMSLEGWVENEHPKNDFEGIFGKRFDDHDGAHAGWVFYFYRVGPYFAFETWKNETKENFVYGGQLGLGFHHVVVERVKRDEGLVHVVFVDGKRAAEGSPADSESPDTNALLSIGGDWSGTLDELAIYDHSLSDERVAAHFAARRR